MMRGYLILIIQLIFCVNSIAQITIAEFLKSATEDAEVKTFIEQGKYLQQKTYRLPFLQRLELRTQNRELLANQQEYAIRFTPSNPWEVRNNNRYFQEYQNSLGMQGEFILKSALQDRYTKVVELLYLADIVDQKKKLIKLNSDQITILEKQMGSSFFDADEYVNLQVKKLDEESDLEELKFLTADQEFSIVRTYQRAFNNSISWNFATVISPEAVKKVVDSLDSHAIQSRLIAYQKQKIRLAEQEYALEKANINVGFVQAEFDNRRVAQNRTPINISGGITIPIFNPNKGDMTRRKLDAIDASFDLEEAQAEDKMDKMIMHERIIFLCTRYAHLQQKITTLNDDKVTATLQTLKSGDPMVRLKFMQSVIKLEVLLGKIRRDILLAYVEFLFTSDFIQQAPLTNYLSPRLEEM